MHARWDRFTATFERLSRERTFRNDFTERIGLQGLRAPEPTGCGKVRASWNHATGPLPMTDGHTTAAVQKYLDALAGDESAEPIVRALLARSAARLQGLSANLLYRNYPRLARPPLNLHDDELLGAVVERLLKAMRTVRPGTVRQFFALANQHIRWELNDLARRLDDRPRTFELIDGPAPSSPSTVPPPGPNMVRMLEAIESLPEEERETFSLVRIQGMTQGEAADVLGVSAKTVQRRVIRSRLLLMDRLADLGAAGGAASAAAET